MNLTIDASWKNQLKAEFEKPYFIDLMNFVEKEYATHTCYPEKSNIFAAFNACSFENTKVVLLGQDPYHGPNQANGLSFSVTNGISHPPSLVNIFKELGTDIGIAAPESGDLNHWAKQGVLLLNATLTVRAQEAGSHQKKGWEVFTDAVIKKISLEKNNIVFLLWGGFAKKKTKLIDTEKHYLLSGGHPSPLSANRGYWFGNKHFSQTNKLLMKSGKSAIQW